MGVQLLNNIIKRRMKKNRIKNLIKYDWMERRFILIKKKYKDRETNNEEGD